MAPRSVPASAAVTATAASASSSSPSPATAGRGDPRCPACCHACRQQAAASTSARPSPTALGGSVQLAPAPFLLDQHNQPQPQQQAGLQGVHGQQPQVDGLVAATGAMAIDPRINLNAHQQDSVVPTTQQAPAPAAAAPTTRKSRHHRHGHGHHHHHHHRHHGGSKPKRPPPAPPADGSQAAPVPPKPVLPPDGSVKTCEAVDRYDELCDEVVVGGWKGKVPRRWCQIHEDEEKHVRSSFWSTCRQKKLFSCVIALALTISDFRRCRRRVVASATFSDSSAASTGRDHHVDFVHRARSVGDGGAATHRTGQAGVRRVGVSSRALFRGRGRSRRSVGRQGRGTGRDRFGTRRVGGSAPERREGRSGLEA